MGPLWAVLLSLMPLSSAQDAAEIVRKSVNLDSSNWDLARNYTFIERNVRKNFDSSGNLKTTESETHEILILYGQPYNKLIARNDQPLPEKEAKKVQEKLDKLVVEREHETPEQRAKRLADFENRRRKQRELFREVPEAFDFRITREEKVNGHDTWVIEARPRQGYKARDPVAARVFPKVAGTLWIEKSGYQWVKVEMETQDTISYGLFLARLAKGTRVEFEQVRVNDEVWLPLRIHGRANARLALVKKMNTEIDVTFKDYRKFQSDSRVVSTAEVPEGARPKY